MDSLKTMFFEDPLYVYISLVFAELVLGAIWHERRTRRWAASLLVPPVLAAAVLAVASLVVTDREQIVQALRDIARDAEAGSVKAAEKYVDDEFAGFYKAKQVLLQVGRQALQQYPVKEVRFSKLLIEVNDDRATAHVITIITIGGEMHAQTSLIWDVRWIKRPEGWRILDVDQPTHGVELL